MDEFLVRRYKSLIRVLAMYVEIGKHKWLVSYPLLIVNIVERMSIACTGIVLRMRASASRLPPLAIVARSIHTETFSPKQSLARLNQQRSVRPNSPHLTIYQPQLTSVLSVLHRGTGLALSGMLYAGALTFLLNPIYQVIDSAHLIEFVAGLPGWLKMSIKAIVSVPFTFHSFNGLRHLMWDMGYGLTLKTVYATGYAVVALTFASSIGLALL